MAIERTLSIIKPDATRRNLTGKINAKFEDAGLRIVAQKRIHLTKAQAGKFYEVHAARGPGIEHDDGLVLVDTGLGNKGSDKFRAVYGVENTGRQGPTQLEDALAEAGFTPDDVQWVINTHLHFDHAGGNTFQEPADAGSGRREGRSRSPALSFPNATYVVQQGELEFATHTNERTAASYLEHNIRPVGAAGRWRLVSGETELLPGIRLVPTPGHVPHHQSVVVADGGERACFLADLVPTFLTNCRTHARSLRAAAAAGDLAAAASVGHKLAGSGTRYGFERVSDLGHEIERSAKVGDARAVGDLAQQLEDYLARVRAVSG